MLGRDTPPAPLERGDLGYSFEELVAAKSEVLSVRLQVVALDLGSCAWALHTPGPSLGRGGSGAAFFLMMSGLWRGDSPLERGLRGVLR